MPYSAHVPTDGNRVVLGNFEHYPNATVFVDRSDTAIFFTAPASYDFGWVIGGTEYLTMTTTAFVPTTTDGMTLGTSLLNFADLFLDLGAVINFDSGDVTVTHSANTLAIAGGDLTIESGFGLNIGSTTQATVSDGDGATNLIPEGQLLGVGTAFAGGALILGTFNATNTRAVSPKLAFVKGAAATQVATTAVADNEVIGSILGYASDGADFETPVAAIEFVVDDVGAPGAGAVGGSIEFYTTADGGEVLTLAATVTNAQVWDFPQGVIRVGTSGNILGTILIDGNTSGTVTVDVAPAAGTWSFTLPNTAGETGDVLVTDGSGNASWVSGVRSVDVQLTNAQVLALRATPITLVAAPGANRALVLHKVYLVCSAAAGAYTETIDNLVVEYSGGTDATGAIETTGWIDAAAVSPVIYFPVTTVVVPVANEALRLFNTGDGEFGGGNAANTLSVRVWYSVVDTVAFS